MPFMEISVKYSRLAFANVVSLWMESLCRPWHCWTAEIFPAQFDIILLLSWLLRTQRVVTKAWKWRFSSVFRITKWICLHTYFEKSCFYQRNKPKWTKSTHGFYILYRAQKWKKPRTHSEAKKSKILCYLLPSVFLFCVCSQPDWTKDEQVGQANIA